MKEAMPSLSFELHLRAADVTLFRIPTLLRFRGQTELVLSRELRSEAPSITVS
jgi:hypothetical protein